MHQPSIGHQIRGLEEYVYSQVGICLFSGQNRKMCVKYNQLHEKVVTMSKESKRQIKRNGDYSSKYTIINKATKFNMK